MKKFIAKACLVFSSLILTNESSAQNVFHSNSFQFSGDPDEIVHTLLHHPDGGVLVCGTADDRSDLSPSPTATFPVLKGNNFLARYSINGELMWAKEIGGSMWNVELLINPAGDIFLAANSSTDMHYYDENGDIVLLDLGNTDLTFAKYSETGNLVWAKLIGNNSYVELGGTALHTSGNILFYINLIGITDVDPDSANVYNIITSPINQFKTAIVQYDDTSGAFVNAMEFTGGGTQDAGKMITDPSGNIYLAGNFTDSIDIDPGAGIQYLTAMGSSTCLFSLDQNFQPLQGMSLPGGGNKRITGLKMDASNQLVMTGTFSYSLDLDPGAANYTVTGYVTNSYFIARYTTSMQFVSGFALARSSNTFSLKQTDTDASGAIYATFEFDQTFDADPGPPTVNYTAVGSSALDQILLKFDSFNQFAWGYQLGNSRNNYSTGLDVNDAGNIWLSGNFNDLIDVDAGPGSAPMLATWPQNTNDDSFIARYNQCSPFISTTNQTICEGQSVQFGPELLNKEGLYKRIVPTTTCDSIITINLVVIKHDPVIALADSMLVCLNPSGVMTWLKGPGMTVAGTGSSFQPLDNSTYYLASINSGCADTSSGLQRYYAANNTIPVFEWARQIPVEITGAEKTIHVNQDEQIFTSGGYYFQQEISLDSSSHIIASTGNSQDIFALKINPDLSFEYALAMGNSNNSSSEDYTTASCIDYAGNFIIAGVHTTAPFDIDPGRDVVMADSGSYMAKYNKGGDLLFAITFRPVGSGSSIFTPSSMTTDGSGNIYVAGSYTGTIDFDPGPGDSIPDSYATSCAVAKYSADGIFQWAFSIKGNTIGEAKINSMDVDRFGNITIGGFYNYIFQLFGQNYIGASPNQFGFYARLDSSLNVKYVSHNTPQWCQVTAVDNNAAGISYGATSESPFCGFYARDTSGASISFNLNITVIGGVGILQFKDVAIDKLGGVYLTGRLFGNVVFEGDTLNSFPSGENSFVAKVGGKGQSRWAFALNAEARSITMDPNLNVYVAGKLHNNINVDFDPGTDSTFLTSNYENFIVKYSQSCALIDTALTIADSLITVNSKESYYELVDCNTGQVVAAGSSSTMIPPVTGDYKVIIYQGPCVDSSGCHSINVTVSIGINDNLPAAVEVKPVPSKAGDPVSLKLNDVQEIKKVMLLSGDGRTYKASYQISGNEIMLSTSNLSPGIYFVMISFNEEMLTTKIVLIN